MRSDEDTKSSAQVRALIAYFAILTLLCAAVVVGARLAGKQGAYLAQFYMLTPAIAALITRVGFYPSRFRDANLRFGRLRDYGRYWLIALAIVAAYYLSYWILGAVTWDLSGDVFLKRLAQQFAAAGQDMNSSLPPGMTPRSMLFVYVVGGLSLFNIPGIITGFGEEFGHRGFMFPALYRISPRIAFVIGGLIWFLWHIPLVFVVPSASATMSAGERTADILVLAAGAICTFIYLAYVYVRSRSVFVTAWAHIALNNASMALSYFAVSRSQLLADVGTSLVMALVLIILHRRHCWTSFAEYFAASYPGGG